MFPLPHQIVRWAAGEHLHGRGGAGGLGPFQKGSEALQQVEQTTQELL